MRKKHSSEFLIQALCKPLSVLRGINMQNYTLISVLYSKMFYIFSACKNVVRLAKHFKMLGFEK